MQRLTPGLAILILTLIPKGPRSTSQTHQLHHRQWNHNFQQLLHFINPHFRKPDNTDKESPIIKIFWRYLESCFSLLNLFTVSARVYNGFCVHWENCNLGELLMRGSFSIDSFIIFTCFTICNSFFIGKICMVKWFLLDKSPWSLDLTTLYISSVLKVCQPMRCTSQRLPHCLFGQI